MIEHHPSGETLVRFAAGDLATGPALVVASHIAQCRLCQHETRVLENVGGAVLDTETPVPLDDLDDRIQALLADPEKAAREREREYRRKHRLAEIVYVTDDIGGDARAGFGADMRETAGRSGARQTAREHRVVRRDASGQLGPLGSDSVAPSAGATKKARNAPSFPAGMVLPGPLAAYDISNWRFVAPGIQWAKVSMPDDASAKVLLLRARPKTALPMHTHSGVEYTCILHGAFSDDGMMLRTGDLGECSEGHRHQPVVDERDECVCVLAVDGQLVMEGWLARLAQRIVGL